MWRKKHWMRSRSGHGSDPPTQRLNVTMWKVLKKHLALVTPLSFLKVRKWWVGDVFVHIHAPYLIYWREYYRIGHLSVPFLAFVSIYSFCLKKNAPRNVSEQEIGGPEWAVKTWPRAVQPQEQDRLGTYVVLLLWRCFSVEK